MTKGLTIFNYIPGVREVSLVTMHDGCCRRIHEGTQFEPESLAEWAELCSRPGAIALDIGAYTGLYSIVAAKLGASVTAVEPLSSNVVRMKINRELNEVKFPIMQYAASDREGEEWLHYNPRLQITSGATLVPGKYYSRRAVRTARLDALPLTGLTVIKCDVERAEVKAIGGCVGLIGRYSPSLIVEALSSTLLRDICALLPRYRVVRPLDKHNVLLQPR